MYENWHDVRRRNSIKTFVLILQNLEVNTDVHVNYVLGSPPSKVYGNLRNLASRASERL